MDRDLIHPSISSNDCFFVLQVADLIEECLKRKPEDRPSARMIFETLSDLLPYGARGSSDVLSTLRIGALSSVAEDLSPVAEAESTSFGEAVDAKILPRLSDRSLDSRTGTDDDDNARPLPGSSDPHTTSGSVPRSMSTDPGPQSISGHSTSPGESRSCLSTVAETSSTPEISSGVPGEGSVAREDRSGDGVNKGAAVEETAADEGQADEERSTMSPTHGDVAM
jgi:hypothetical protein